MMNYKVISACLKDDRLCFDLTSCSSCMVVVVSNLVLEGQCKLVCTGAGDV